MQDESFLVVVMQGYKPKAIFNTIPTEYQALLYLSSGIQKSCQDVRAQAGVLTADKLQIVYMVPSQPMPVACRLLVNPAIGQLVSWVLHTSLSSF